ncbi:MAG: urease accessory protein UreD [Nocardioides sp.]
MERDPDGRRARVWHHAGGGPHRPAIRPAVLSVHDTGARVALVPEGALLLSGDDVTIHIEVGPGAALELIEPTGTVAYDMRGGKARWDTSIELAAGARLVWHGEPFVVCAGAVVTRTQRVTMAAGSRLALRETLVLGRHGEAGGTLTQQTVASNDLGEPLIVDGFAIGPDRSGLPTGDQRSIASVLTLGARFEFDCSGVMQLETTGTLWRALDDPTHLVTREPVWRAATDVVHR